MRIELPEAGRRGARSSGAALLSVLLHATLVGVWMYTTADATVRRDASSARETLVLAAPPAAPALRNARPSSPRSGPRPTSPPAVSPPRIDAGLLPEHLPVVGLDSLASWVGWPQVGRDSSESPGAGVAPAGDVYEGTLIDEAAVPLRIPMPAYPTPLRAAGVEGRVTVQFVVDTAGSVDASSVVILHSDDERFSAAVRRALARYRFAPAVAHGRKVRVRMQQEFVFRMAY